MKYILYILLLVSNVCVAQKIQPTTEETMQIFKFLSDTNYVATLLTNWPDSNTYIEFYKTKEMDKRHGVACFKWYVNPTWDGDRHWIICDCAILDKKIIADVKEYWRHHKKPKITN